jgi:peptide/nickel transport system substrate-binding protein
MNTMKKTKKVLALVLVFLLALSLLCACSKPNDDSKGSETKGSELPGSEHVSPKCYEETVLIGMLSELDSADPYGSGSAECQMMTNMTHLLLAINNTDSGELDPISAEKWEDMDKDGKKWRITLKKGVLFHNGEEMTAEDVKFTWEYVNPDAGNVMKPLAASTYVESIDVEDNYNLVFTLKSAMFDFPTYLETKIYCKKAFDSMSAEDAALVGTGPYYYDKSLYQSGIQYGFTRFDDYYEGVEKYPTKHIVVRYIPEEDARIAAIQAQEIDVVFFQSPSYYGILEGDPNVTAYMRKGDQSYYLGFNFTVDKVKEMKLRQALAMAINRDDIVNVAFEGGLGGAASYNFCVPTGAGYVEVDHVKYDPERSKAILKDLGYEAGLELKLAHYASTKKIAEVVQSNLAKVGVTVSIQQIDDTNWGAFKRSKEGYDIFLDYCSYKGALLYNYNRFLQKDGSSNMNGHFNPEFETLLQNVQNAGSYDDMLAEFAKMQQWVATDCPMIPLAVNNMIGATLNDVEGYVLADTANYMDFSTLRVPSRD